MNASKKASFAFGRRCARRGGRCLAEALRPWGAAVNAETRHTGWGTPVNLGAPVNSTPDEPCPLSRHGRLWARPQLALSPFLSRRLDPCGRYP